MVQTETTQQALAREEAAKKNAVAEAEAKLAKEAEAAKAAEEAEAAKSVKGKFGIIDANGKFIKFAKTQEEAEGLVKVYGGRFVKDYVPK